jgi:LuxR family maltose regulon positive regulatory protein
VNPLTPLDEAIVELIRSTSFEEASERIAAVWEQYLPADAVLLATRIRSLPDELWERDPLLLLAMARTHRAAPTSNPFAALAYLDAATAVLDDRAEVAVRITLERSRAQRGLGRFVDARTLALMARQALASSNLGVRQRLELEAQALFEEGASLALSGELDAASRQIRHGIGLAGDRDLPGGIEALGWLAVIEYFLGRSSGPGQHLAAAETLAAGELTIDLAPAIIAETLIALDELDEERARSLLERLESVADGTEFAPFATQLRASLEGTAAGAFEQLDLLQAVELATHDWQAAALIRSLHDTERAMALIGSGAFGAARDAVAGLPKKNPLHARHAHCPGMLTARLALHTGDYESVLTSTNACRAMGDRHAPRSLAVVEVLRAAAHDGLGDAITAAEALDRALLVAARTGWRRHFTAVPPNRLSAMLDAAASRDLPGPARTVLTDLSSGLGDVVPDTIAPLSSRERLILSQIAAGQTRRQISSKLRVSPNTIKAQVRSIYRKLGASNRHEAIDRAARFGIPV